MSDVYDVVILGGGSAGYATALRAVQLGLSVALVEADKLGGTCLHRGCIPTKALLQAAATADTVRHASGFGVQAELTGIDAAALRDWSDSVVGRLHSGLTGLFSSAEITVITGQGRLSPSPLGIQVDERLIPGRHVVLATGAAPVTLGLPIDGETIITSEHALRLTTLPRRAVVLGGGVIGVELASAWSSLGVEVTVVEALDRLVPAEEPEISAAMLRAFKQRGIAVRLGVKLTGAQANDESVQVSLGDETLTTDVLLVAVGRKADPAAAGASDLIVHDDLTTSVPGVYAIGDLAPGPQLAHRGYVQGHYAAELIGHGLGKVSKRPRRPADALMPKVTYSNPEIVSVGLTTAQALSDGEIETAEYQLTGNGKAQIFAGSGRVRGFVKVVRRKGGAILGVHIVGEHVAELVGEANLLVNWAAEPADLDGIAHAHPTLGEAIGEVSLALAGKPLHMHP